MAENKNKVLIITYYWPPSAGSGVQRWLKFVKYLPQSGWEPFVFTPQNPSFSLRDESLLHDVPPEAKVIRLPIWEPYDVFRKLSGIAGKGAAKADDMMSGKKSSWFKRASTWIRGNVFVPDPRVFWVRPATKFLQQFLSDNNISVIVTTGPPHSMHLIGYRLKKRIPDLKWIADFRDPWSQWGLLDSLSVTEPVRTMHRRIERKILQAADVVTTITPFYVRQFESLGKRKVHLLTNGYDAEDFTEMRIVRPDRFVIRHVGIINEKCDPRPFMNVISKLIETNPGFAADIRMEFIGETHPAFRDYVSGIGKLSAVTAFVPTVPHRVLPALYGSSAVLLLILTGYKDAEGYMPGKLFEYLATGVPVLGVGPDNGDAAALLNETNAGEMIPENDPDKISSVVMEMYQRWRNREAPVGGNRNIEQYSRKGVTMKLSGVLADQVRL